MERIKVLFKVIVSNEDFIRLFITASLLFTFRFSLKMLPVEITDENIILCCIIYLSDIVYTLTTLNIYFYTHTTRYELVNGEFILRVALPSHGIITCIMFVFYTATFGKLDTIILVSNFIFTLVTIICGYRYINLRKQNRDF